MKSGTKNGLRKGGLFFKVAVKSIMIVMDYVIFQVGLCG